MAGERHVAFRTAITVSTACNKHIDKFETVVVKFIEDRAKARAAVFAKASARAKSVGANK